MKIINQTYEETLYRVDVLGEAAVYADWQCNATTVKLPEETVFDARERKIREVQKFGNVELFRNGS
jgi:hypothetical protein